MVNMTLKETLIVSGGHFSQRELDIHNNSVENAKLVLDGKEDQLKTIDLNLLNGLKVQKQLAETPRRENEVEHLQSLSSIIRLTYQLRDKTYFDDNEKKSLESELRFQLSTIIDNKKSLEQSFATKAAKAIAKTPRRAAEAIRTATPRSFSRSYKPESPIISSKNTSFWKKFTNRINGIFSQKPVRSESATSIATGSSTSFTSSPPIMVAVPPANALRPIARHSVVPANKVTAESYIDTSLGFHII